MERTRIYAHDKPGDCANCRYHDWNRDKCYLGKNNCYYLTEIEPEEESECDDCPYRSEEPCLGYCMKKCYAEMREKWGYPDAAARLAESRAKAVRATQNHLARLQEQAKTDPDAAAKWNAHREYVRNYNLKYRARKKAEAAGKEMMTV